MVNANFLVNIHSLLFLIKRIPVLFEAAKSCIFSASCQLGVAMSCKWKLLEGTSRNDSTGSCLLLVSSSYLCLDSKCEGWSSSSRLMNMRETWEWKLRANANNCGVEKYESESLMTMWCYIPGHPTFRLDVNEEERERGRESGRERERGREKPHSLDLCNKQ